MWLEYIRYRFRLHKRDDLLELTQLAALEGLRNSPRCRCWRVLPAADDPSLLVLEIEWDPGVELTPFRGSEEFATIHSALARQTHSLEEADYSVDDRLLRRVLGAPETLFRLAEDIVVGILADPTLAWRFYSTDGSRRGRLGLWLLEVLGGPDLFSSSFPSSCTRDGPLADDLLDLEERERLLEIAKNALPESLDEQGLCVVGNLRAQLPLHPAPPSQLLTPTLLLKTDAEASEKGGSRNPLPADAPDSDVWYGLLSETADDDAVESDVTHLDGAADDAGDDRMGLAPFAMEDDEDVSADEAGEGRSESNTASGPRGTYQTGVRSCVDPAVPAARVAGNPWPHRSRPAPTLRGRTTGKWPRWRDRSR